jgi:hypothetical protein
MAIFTGISTSRLTLLKFFSLIQTINIHMQTIRFTRYTLRDIVIEQQWSFVGASIVPTSKTATSAIGHHKPTIRPCHQRRITCEKRLQFFPPIHQKIEDITTLRTICSTCSAPIATATCPTPPPDFLLPIHGITHAEPTTDPAADIQPPFSNSTKSMPLRKFPLLLTYQWGHPCSRSTISPLTFSTAQHGTSALKPSLPDARSRRV